MCRTLVLVALLVVAVPAQASFFEKCRRAAGIFGLFKKGDEAPAPAPAPAPKAVAARPAEPHEVETKLNDRLTAPTAPEQRVLPRIPPVKLWDLSGAKALKVGKALGSGGNGTVYEAEIDLGDGNPPVAVVVKQLGDETPENIRKALLLIEAEWLSRVYPGDAGVIEVGGVPYMVQKSAGKITVEQASKSVEANRKIIAQRAVPELLDEVERVHQLGLVHRDINPSNLMLGRETKAKIVDFAMMRAHGDKVPGSEMGGRPRYMSPETWISRTVDQASDVFGLGLSVLQLEFPEAFDAPYTITRRLPGKFWSAVGRVPDNAKGIAPERAMAHMTAVKRTIGDYRKLLDASSKSREEFAAEWATQWKKALALAEDRKNPELVKALMYEFFSAPVLGPELWAALKDPVLQAAVLKAGIEHRNKLKSGDRPFAAWGFHLDMMPMFDEFFANPLVKNHPEVKKLK